MGVSSCKCSGLGRVSWGLRPELKKRGWPRLRWGGLDGMASVGWSGLCLGPRPGSGESSEGEENPLADFS